MQLKQKSLRIAKAAGGAELGAVAGGPHPPQQAGFGSTFEWGEQGNGASAFEVLTETAA